MDNPFSWDYLTTVPGPNEVFGPFAVIFLIVFGLGFILSTAIYSGWDRRLIGDPVLRRMARRWSGWAMALFGIGLFFFGIRWLQINPLTFGMRIWLWLCWLALIIFGAYVAWYIRSNYAEQKAAYEEYQRKQQYLRPATAGSAARGGSAAVASGARPVKRRRR
ncbi:MAG TPA: hypothetical protein VIL01_09875 [Thermomicrobiales bacterium]